VENSTIRTSSLYTRAERACRPTWSCLAILLLLTALIPSISRAKAQQSAKPAGSEPTPEPAIPAILAAFDKYEVVGLPAAHEGKELDDFILLLVRNPSFSEKVTDIAVECGNSLYQPILDRYIAGEDSLFSEVRKVWRNTTQPTCGMSTFFERLFPLVRAINQKLPVGKRLRVLACDPPIDWDQVKSLQDILRFVNRDTHIASVMEKEVLSKHRKALMLFGTAHLMHGGGLAVSMYEKNYPNATFVISGLGTFEMTLSALSDSRFAKWPTPALVPAKGTWLGALGVSHFVPPSLMIDRDCNIRRDSPEEQHEPMARSVDAFLYVGPQNLRLNEVIPADVALDVDYIRELQRRASLQGILGFPGVVPGTLKEFNQQIIDGAEIPLFTFLSPSDEATITKDMVQRCLDERKNHSAR
jgi:hypothetical protein